MLLAKRKEGGREEGRKEGKEGRKGTHELRSRKTVPSSVLLELIKSARRGEEISRVEESGGGRHGVRKGREREDVQKGEDGSSPPKRVFARLSLKSPNPGRSLREDRRPR